MKYFLIGNLAGTCNDYGIALFLRSLQRALGIIQFVVPAILVIMATINLVQLMLGPDDPQKRKWKSLINKFIAAVIVFFIPLLFNVVFSYMPESFNIVACWNDAKNIADEMDRVKEERKVQKEAGTKNQASSSVYTSVKESEKKGKMISKNNAKLRKKVMKSSGSNQTSTSSGKGEDVVKEARKYLGNPYVYGGNSLTNGTDCSGFVKLIYAKFGVELPRTASEQSKKGKTVKSLADAQPGDLLFYLDGSGNIGHVTMYEGNNKVIHASSPSTGIKESNANYKTYAKIKRFL